MAFALTMLALVLPSVAAAAPVAPTGLQVTSTGPQQVALMWTATTSTNITGYQVFRNGTQVGVTDSNATNWVDQQTSLVNGTTYTYTVKAYDSSGSSAATSGVSGTPASPTAFPSSCTGTTAISAGHYTLTSDLTTSTGPCITFASGSNISLDCGGHTITENGGYDAIAVNSVGGLLLTHCVIQQNAGYGQAIYAKTSWYTTFLDNTINQGGTTFASIHLEHSPFAVIGGVGHRNTFNSAWVQDVSSNNAYVGYNTFSMTATTVPEAILVDSSNNSTVVSNHIDGGFHGGSVGVDDDIDLSGPVDHLNVSQNTLSNTYDTGIEGEGTVTNSQLNYNTISNVSNAGIGEWFDADFRGNTLTGNTVSGAQHLFAFGNDYATSGAWTLPAGGFNISNNTFTSNSVTAPTGGAIYWSASGDPAYPSYGSTSTGNVFVNNDLSPTDPTITFTPSTATIFSSSTGNYCKSSVSIQCIGQPIVTAGAAPTHNVGGSYTLYAVVDASGQTTYTGQFQYGTTTSYGSTVSSGSVARGTPTSVNGATTVLTPGVTYHYRLVIANDYGTTYGADHTFVA